MSATQPYQGVLTNVKRLADPPQHLPETLLDRTLEITEEHLGKMRLNELCVLWMEGRL